MAKVAKVEYQIVNACYSSTFTITDGTTALPTASELTLLTLNAMDVPLATETIDFDSLIYDTVAVAQGDNNAFCSQFRTSVLQAPAAGIFATFDDTTTPR